MKSLKYTLAVLALSICFCATASADAERTLNEMNKNYNFTPEQREKALAILKEGDAEMAKVQKGGQKKAIDRRFRDKVRNEVLAPEQQAKFDALRAKAEADAAAKKNKQKENKPKGGNNKNMK